MAHCTRSLALALIILNAGALWAFETDFGGLFMPPESPFMTSPDEQIVTVDATDLPVAELQARLDAARREAPDAVILARVSGTLAAGDSALRLASKMCLEFVAGASMRAVPPATPKALIQVQNAEFVSIFSRGLDRGVLDGGGNAALGIEVRDSGKVNIDNLLIRDCATGIAYDGRGGDVFCDGGSITRCRLERCAASGATVTGVAQFVCLDNQFVNNDTCGLTIASMNCVVAGNVFTACQTGLAILSEDGVFARNVMRGNTTALEFRSDAKLNLISYNRIEENKLGMRLAGVRNSVYYNEMANETEFEIGGEENVIVGHRGVKPEEAVGAGNTYFNPPTFGNDHQDATIVNGMGRFDIEVQGGRDEDFQRRESRPPEERCELVPLSTVQKALDEAREAHPADVIVAHLKGLFIGDGEGTGLALPENTCVVLDGVIRSDSEGLDYRTSPQGNDTQLIMMARKGFASFSGGIVDANSQPYHAINSPGQNIAVIDGVTVKRAGFNGITTKHHGRQGMPLFIRGCTVVDCGNRGIWIHVCNDVHAIDNVSSGNISDGIDLDAYGNHSTALFNTCTANRRHGVFVEEGVTNNIVLGNVLNGNYGLGIWVWDEAVEGNTGQNAMVSNVCRGNTSGFGVGGRAAEKSANGNFFFNNAAIDNRTSGLRYGNRYSRGNYFSQSVTRGNAQDVVNWTESPITLFFADPR